MKITYEPGDTVRLTDVGVRGLPENLRDRVNKDTVYTVQAVETNGPHGPQEVAIGPAPDGGIVWVASWDLDPAGGPGTETMDPALRSALAKWMDAEAALRAADNAYQEAGDAFLRAAQARDAAEAAFYTTSKQLAKGA